MPRRNHADLAIAQAKPLDRVDPSTKLGDVANQTRSPPADARAQSPHRTWNAISSALRTAGISRRRLHTQARRLYARAFRRYVTGRHGGGLVAEGVRRAKPCQVGSRVSNPSPTPGKRIRDLKDAESPRLLPFLGCCRRNILKAARPDRMADGYFRGYRFGEAWHHCDSAEVVASVPGEGTRFRCQKMAETC